MAARPPVPDLAREDYLRRLTQATWQGAAIWDTDPLPLWDIPWTAACNYNGQMLYWLWPALPDGRAGLAAMESRGPRWLATPADCPHDLLFEHERAIGLAARR